MAFCLNLANVTGQSFVGTITGNDSMLGEYKYCYYLQSITGGNAIGNQQDTENKYQSKSSTDLTSEYFTSTTNTLIESHNSTSTTQATKWSYNSGTYPSLKF